jgi:hypothetical protein
VIIIAVHLSQMGSRRAKEATAGVKRAKLSSHDNGHFFPRGADEVITHVAWAGRAPAAWAAGSARASRIADSPAVAAAGFDN